MLVLRPSMIDLIIHFDCPPTHPTSPSLSSPFYGFFFGNCAKSKMLAPSVLSGALLTDMLPVAQCPEYCRSERISVTPGAVLVCNCRIVRRKKKD